MRKRETKPTHALPAPVTEPAERPPIPGRVWEAWERYDDDAAGHVLAGLLVTDRDDPSRLLAFLFGGAGELQHVTDECRALADRIAHCPERAGDHHPHLWDMRDYCRPDSPRPTPHVFYGYQIAPPGTNGRHLMPCVPFCRFRLAKMAATFLRQQWPDAGPDLPFVCVGMFQHLDEDGEGDGANHTWPVNVDPAEIPL